MRLALAFLTRLPGGRHPGTTAELAAAVAWFPVIGAVVGALGGVTYLALAAIATPLVAAGGALAATAAVTGALHEDGLADTLDGLAGGTDVEARRRILHDSRLGTFGVLALVLVTLTKAAALADLASLESAGRLSRWVPVLALVGAHVAARTGSVLLLARAPVAPGNGSGRTLADAVRAGPVAVGSAAGLGLTAVALTPIHPFAGLWAAVAVAVLALATVWWARARIGGVTGDIIGAAEQFGELGVLVAVAAVV